ncbi:ATP-binding protein [Dyella humicola]|uniref:ATP-binding protein n=1 Tax=Dyella humicola TaxID=2992126 RepID=UPI0022583CB1|nr:ATP-binding protein [Dyella humicola]
MFNDTVSALAAITDAAQFERIATAVLRCAIPSLYANLSHQGVNTDGKTVKAPLDNVGWVHTGGGAMLVAVAHTTAARGDLDGKWLHDPATVKPRKKGRKPTQPAGDLVKAIEEIGEIRKDCPGLEATLALTTNREEPAEVRVKAHKLAEANDISIDVWSVSRLAQFLDTNPEGQAIRLEYLGVNPTRLSMKELLRVGKKCLSSRLVETTADEVVARDMSYLSGHALLSGASGMGKTTVCTSALSEALRRNRPCIVIEDQTIRQAVTIEEALDIELRRYSSSLEANSGTRALELCSELEPLLVVVEDINRSDNTERLLNKLISWALRSSPGTIDARWRLACPVWPRFLASIDKKEEVDKAGMVHVIGLYTDDQAREAVQRRGTQFGQALDELAAAAIAKALGNDPLLIGLYDFRSSAPSHNVIAKYVADELDRVSLRVHFTTSELEDAIRLLATEMLEMRNLQPTWRDVQSWLTNERDVSALRALVADARLLRLSRSGRGEVLDARHDRVLFHILADAVSHKLQELTGAAYFSDPYFAEIVGMGAVICRLESERLVGLMTDSPLVPFYALKYALGSGGDYANAAAGAIEQWVQSEGRRGAQYFGRRYLGLVILAEIDDPIVSELTSMFPAEDMHQAFFEARFRNGDIGAGLNWLTEYSFEVSFPGRRELVDRVRQKYGSALVRALDAILRNQGVPERALVGALILAGYIAEPSLAPAVREAWRHCVDSRHLRVFLWAAARVCGDEAEATLAPICDAWEALPHENGVNSVSPRNDLAAYGVDWKFSEEVPRSAIPYFVERAARSEALYWQITFMLRGVDDPVAVQHEAEYLARRSRDADGGGFIDHFLKDEWRRRDEQGRPMSRASKDRLFGISDDDSNDDHLRKQAFYLWESSVDSRDVGLARTVAIGDVRFNASLWCRARRGDLTVVSDILLKIDGNPKYWWQVGRYLWSPLLTDKLQDALEDFASSPAQQKEDDVGWILPELILRLDLETAERILLGVWSKLGRVPWFLQAALVLATPKLVGLAAAVLEEATDPSALLKHFSFTAGLGINGRDGFTRSRQVEVLQPYLHLLSDHDLFRVWDVCIKRGWLDLAHNHVEPVIRGRTSELALGFRGSSIDSSGLDAELDGSRAGTARFWFEDAVRRGASRTEVIPYLFDWLKERNTAAALAVVAEVLAQDGSRRDFEQLKEIAMDAPNSEPIMETLQFDIYRRTLT